MAKFYTDRYWFKYGNEDDKVECTTKSWNTFEEAQAYSLRYAKGIKFYYVEILDENCNVLWRYNNDGLIEDFRDELDDIETTEKVENSEIMVAYEIKKIKAVLKPLKMKKVITQGKHKIKPLKRILEGTFIRGSPLKNRLET